VKSCEPISALTACHTRQNKKRKKSGSEPKKKEDPHESRIVALSAFGVAATGKQIEAAMKTLPPTAQTEEEILRHLVLQLRKQA
jgi:hypothetical protein